MSDELEVLEEWAGALLAKLEPGERRKLLGQVARDLRRNQQRRIAAQKAPDGTAYAPRKRRAHGRIKGRMFLKIRTLRFLKVMNESGSAAVGFMGRVARIARAHQAGQTGHARPGHPARSLPARPLLGLNDAAARAIRDALNTLFE